MSKVLYIKANPKNENSRTFELSDYYIQEYIKKNPKDEIITLDLYKENIGFLTSKDVLAHNNADEESISSKYAKQFLSVDKIVISAPFWNLSIPAILKAYIDYICVKGITFKYTKEGPVGLCTDKKILHIVTRGGDYENEITKNFEMGDRYLSTIFGFLGITDFTTVSADKLDVIGEDVEKIISESKLKLDNLAKTF